MTSDPQPIIAGEFPSRFNMTSRKAVYDPNGISPTLTADDGRGGHPVRIIEEEPPE